MSFLRNICVLTMLIHSACSDAGGSLTGGEQDYSDLAGYGEPCRTAADCNPDEADACLVERGKSEGICSLECGSNSDCGAVDGVACESLCSKGWWCVEESAGCTEDTCMDDCCEQYDCDNDLLFGACVLDCDQDPCIHCNPVQFEVN